MSELSKVESLFDKAGCSSLSTRPQKSYALCHEISFWYTWSTFEVIHLYSLHPIMQKLLLPVKLVARLGVL